MDITTDYYYNVALVCKDGIQFDDMTTVDDILPLLDTTPCLSVIALCTLLKIDGFYPVNPDFEAQKSLLEGLSTQILVDFEVVLEREQKRNMDECALADIDFEFLIDSSGWDRNIFKVYKNRLKFDSKSHYHKSYHMIDLTSLKRLNWFR